MTPVAKKQPSIEHLSLEQVSKLATFYRRETKLKIDVDSLQSLLEKDAPCYVAVHNDEIVGYAIGGSFAPDIVELRDILVGGRVRNRGIGTRLLEKFEQGARKRSARAIILVNSRLYPRYEGKGNPARFYLRNGYTELLATDETRVYGKVFAKT